MENFWFTVLNISINKKKHNISIKNEEVLWSRILSIRYESVCHLEYHLKIESECFSLGVEVWIWDISSCDSWKSFLRETIRE